MARSVCLKPVSRKPRRLHTLHTLPQRIRFKIKYPLVIYRFCLLFSFSHAQIDFDVNDNPPDYAVDGELGPVCSATCPLYERGTPLEPVCGTNGKTYESRCILELVACVIDDPELRLDYEGECVKEIAPRLSQKF